MAALSSSITLADLVRAIGGWPIDLDAVCVALAAADRVLPQGRNYRGDITPAQLKKMGYEEN